MTERTEDNREIVNCRLEFRVLGPVQVLDGDGDAIDVGGSKPRLVLVQLLLNANRVVSTDALVDAVWGEDPPPSARRSLQSHLAKLRAALGGDDGPIRSQPPGYVLAIDEDQVDLWRSENLVRQARASMVTNPRLAHHFARQAQQQWTSEPLADLAAHDPLIPQRRRLEQLRLDLIELELDAEMAAGDTATAVERLEALLVDRPEHEPFWARLMTGYYRLGRQSDALRAFQRARAALVDALGIDPSPELQRLESAILGQSAELTYTAAAVCPYKGLASYQLDDADVFYGRDDLVAELFEAVRVASFVVVVGSSGAGKSSALRAGLVKSMEARKIVGLGHPCVITPGPAPLRSIYQVPTSADVIIVDQFEELFTLTDNEAVRREFVRTLLAPVNDGTGRVLISLRADFYGYCTRIPELAPLLARRQVVVGPLSEQELRAVITKPADKAGLVVDPELVDIIVAEAANHAGVLPLVSHAMVETWHRRADDHLTLDAYREAGSIGAAIARTAERFYGSFQAEQRAQVERLFLRLVEPGEGTEHSRRRLFSEQLEGSSIDREVIDLLVEARLLTAGAEGIEIVHEALIEAWPRLGAWIDDNRDSIRMHRHLTSAAGAWAELEHDEGELYRGARLAAALSWIGDSMADLSDVERDFIDASVGVSEKEIRLQVKANRRLRILVAVTILGAMVAVAGTVLAISKANDADRGRRVAEAAQLVTNVLGQPDLPPSSVLQLAVEADRRASTSVTQSLLLDSIARNPGPTSRKQLDALVVGSAPISANGGILPVINNNVEGMVLDAGTLELRVRNLRPAPAVIVDTGSRLLGVMVTGGRLQTKDLTTHQSLGPPPAETAGPSQFALSRDGMTLAIANPSDGSAPAASVSLYDVASGKQRLSMAATGSGAISNVNFSPDGRHLLALIGSNDFVVWDTTTGRAVFETPPEASQRAAVTALAMSPSSSLIGLGREDGTVEIWASDDGGHWLPVEIKSLHQHEISWIDFDSKGRRMVSTSRDGVAIVWNTVTGERVAAPQAFGSDGGPKTYFRPESSTKLVNVQGNHVSEWELQQAGGLLTTVAGVNLGASVAASSGTRVLVSTPTEVKVHDPSGGTPRTVHFDPGDTPIRGVAQSADGHRFVVVYDDGRIELRDTLSGELVIAFGPRALLSDIMITLDGSGKRVALLDKQERVEIIDDEGTVVDTIRVAPPRLPLQALDLKADGSELVVSTKGGEAIWYEVDGIGAGLIADIGTGFDAQFLADDRVAVVGGGAAQIIDPRSPMTAKRLALGVDVTRLAIDGTGRLLATADATGLIQLWDAKTLATFGPALQVGNIATPVPIRFSTDGRYLLVSGSKEIAWLNLSTADWPRIACGLVTEALSPDERARYLGSREAAETCR